MQYKLVSIDRIFAKLVRDVGDDFSESDVIEWAGEALGFIGAIQLYDEAIAFVEVKNHQCSVPNGTFDVMQIARDNRWEGPTKSAFCAKEVIEEVKRLTISYDNPNIPVVLDCHGQPVVEYDLAYYRPYFDLKWEHDLWYGSGVYQRFSPIRKSTGNFFGDFGRDGVHGCTNDEYKIIRGDTIRFSFPSGMVAIAYHRTPLDEETGYPLVPDHISYTTAIIKYVTYMMLNKQCIAGRQGTCGLADRAKQDWHWYCAQAGNAEMMPYGEDEYQNLLDQRSHILPKRNRYHGFFGNLNKPEGRKWNDPNQRNSGTSYY